MTKFLIVNADDFGLCPEISDGIIKAFSEGIVTSTSVVANGRSFKDYIEFLKKSGIDTGIHLTFTGGEKPISGNIDGLVDDNGCFLKSYREVIPRIVLGHFDRVALEKELTAQVGLLLNNGIDVSHLDSHQHLHVLPGVRNIVIRLAKRFNIRWIRVPHINRFNLNMFVMNVLSASLKSELRKHSINFTNAFKGFEYGGHVNETNIAWILKGLENNITELMVHPGYDASHVYDWGYAWEDELKALTSPYTKRLIKDNEIILTSFKEIK
ncbi:MAG: carbohydrate deacetylase [bacterium]